MNVTLKPFDFARPWRAPGWPRTPALVERQRGGRAGFQHALTQRWGREQVADRCHSMQREVQLDNPTVSLEQTMVAMQKAQIGFQGTLQVRNKLVQAYSDIMAMQV